jgi:hypothetical protein
MRPLIEDHPWLLVALASTAGEALRLEELQRATRASWPRNTLLQWSLAAIAERLPLRVILDDDGTSPYLSRNYLLHVLRERLPGVFLHFFHRGDHYRELHNHPWDWSLALVLTGGYREERVEGRDGERVVKTVKPWRINFLRAETYHRVELLDPEQGAWTLFIAGPKRQDWGFLDVATRAYESNMDRFRRVTEERKRAARQKEEAQI